MGFERSTSWASDATACYTQLWGAALHMQRPQGAPKPIAEHTTAAVLTSQRLQQQLQRLATNTPHFAASLAALYSVGRVRQTRNQHSSGESAVAAATEVDPQPKRSSEQLRREVPVPQSLAQADRPDKTPATATNIPLKLTSCL
jgi:hypothetical protein